MDRSDDPVANRRAWFFNGFRDVYVPRYLRKHFHAVRLSKTSAALPLDDAPIIVALNHPAWWDPLICAHLTVRFGPREHFAAIGAEAMQKYKFFAKLGFFGVDAKSLRGAAAFLRTSQYVLNAPNRVLWITAQGRFSDVRQRPLNLQSGVGHLAARMARGWVVPIALEYAFWTERTPEAFVRIGTPLDISASPGLHGREWIRRIEAALTTTLDGLNQEVITRDDSLFEPLIAGKTGVGGAYDFWRRLKAWGTLRKFRPGHAEGPS